MVIKMELEWYEINKINDELKKILNDCSVGYLQIQSKITGYNKCFL